MEKLGALYALITLVLERAIVEASLYYISLGTQLSPHSPACWHQYWEPD